MIVTAHTQAQATSIAKALNPLFFHFPWSAPLSGQHRLSVHRAIQAVPLMPSMERRRVMAKSVKARITGRMYRTDG